MTIVARPSPSKIPRGNWNGPSIRPAPPSNSKFRWSIRRAPQAIGSIKGKLKALLPGKIETFEFAGLKDTKKVEQHRAGVTVAVDEVRQDGDAWEVRMRVRFDNAANAGNIPLVDLQQRGLSERSQGEIPNGGFETTVQSKTKSASPINSICLTAPAALRSSTKRPRCSRALRLPFEFKNLPLP